MLSCVGIIHIKFKGSAQASQQLSTPSKFSFIIQYLYTKVNIPFTTAVFGGEAKVTTLYGDVICKIPEGTQSGRKIRLKGKGIVSMKDSAVHGNQYVTVQIQVPQNLSPEAKEKLREFQQVLRKDTQKRRGSAA